MKTNKGRKSQKGKWGSVGAPPKKTSWPVGPFSTAILFKRNSKGANAQCELSLRTKLDVRLANGEVIELKAKKQKGGAVGRPKSMFILATKFNVKKHVKVGAIVTPKTRKARVTAVVVADVAAPAVAPVVNVISTTAPVADTVPATIEPQPEATAPVETVVETAPTPAPSEAPVAPSEPVVSQ